MKRWLVVLSAALIGTSAFAQSTTVIKRDGTTGSTVVKERSVVDHDEDEGVVVKKRVTTTGSVGCTEKTKTKTDAFGDTTVKKKTTC
jgi:hypothetical protein